MRHSRRLTRLRRMLLRKRWLLTSLLIVGFAVTGRAQSSPDLNHRSSLTAPPTSERFVVPPERQDDPIAKALEIATNRLAVAEEQNRLKDTQLEAKDTQIAAKDEIIKYKDLQIKFHTENRTDLNSIASGDARLFARCEQQLSAADAEIHRLRYPGFFRSIFDPKAITGAAVGFGVGRLTK